MNKLCAIDCETTGLSWYKDQLLGVGVYSGDTHAQYYGEGRFKELINTLSVMSDHGFKFVAHNSKFDWWFLRKADIIKDDFNFYFDTRLARPLLADQTASSRLESMCAHYLKTIPWKDEVTHKNMAHEDPEIVADYCLKDCEETLKLAHLLIEKLQEEGQWEFYAERLLPLDQCLCRASYRGIALDITQVAGQKERYQERLTQALASIRQTYHKYINPFEQLQLERKLSNYKTDKGRDKAKENPPQINLSSSKQLMTLFHTYMGLDIRDANGKPSVSEQAMQLNKDKHPIILDMLRARELSKPIQFFTQWGDYADESNRIHTTFNVDIARTGRLSSTDPNLQQIPVRRDPSIRHCFVASQGMCLVIRDLSQIEPRLIAHYSQDPKLTAVYTDNTTLYGVVACELGLWKGDPNDLKKEDKKLYNVAKTIVLAILYGMGARTMSIRLTLDASADYSVRDCRGFIETFFAAFPRVAELRDATATVAERRGYLRNLFGRHVFVPRERSHRVALNTLIQSSASDFMCFLQLEQQKMIAEFNSHLLLLIHDEEVYEAPESKAFLLDRYLADAATDFGKQLGLRVPIETEGGVYKKWGGEPLTEVVNDQAGISQTI